jgi:hypothetical protein
MPYCLLNAWQGHRASFVNHAARLAFYGETMCRRANRVGCVREQCAGTSRNIATSGGLRYTMSLQPRYQLLAET